jgi:aryl-alcohol dehydrogenase-like predicted oxidoreductase
MGLTTFSPLAFGILSGKYSAGIPAGSRLAEHPMWQSEDMAQRIQKTRALLPITKSLGCTLSQLAIAWCLKNSHVSSVIVGASTLDQLKENLSAVAVTEHLNETILGEIKKITRDA